MEFERSQRLNFRVAPGYNELPTNIPIRTTPNHGIIGKKSTAQTLSGVSPNQINQGKPKLRPFKYIPSEMKTIPSNRFQKRNFKKGYARIIEIPIKCNTPNTTKQSLKKMQVIKVMTKPHEKTFSPLFRYFRYIFPRIVLVREKLSVSDIPTKRIKIVAVARAKNNQKPECELRL